MLIIVVVAMILVKCSAAAALPTFGYGGCEYCNYRSACEFLLNVYTIFILLKIVGPSGTGAGFGTGSAGFGGVSASGVGISSAQNGGFGVGSGSGSAFSGGLFGGQYATGTGNGFSFGK
jgi:hypothetical protein